MTAKDHKTKVPPGCRVFEHVLGCWHVEVSATGENLTVCCTAEQDAIADAWACLDARAAAREQEARR